MNLRILKKLSKRAAPLLLLLDDRRQQFPAEKHDNYAHTLILDRKHWERGTCHPTYKGRNDWSDRRGAQRLYTTRAGRTMVMSPPMHPRKGTVMVGAMSCGEEPEWSEETTLESLCGMLHWHFVEISDDGMTVTPTRSLRTPSEIFKAAHDMAAELAAERAARAERRRAA